MQLKLMEKKSVPVEKPVVCASYETRCSVRLNGWMVDKSQETINRRSLDFVPFCHYS